MCLVEPFPEAALNRRTPIKTLDTIVGAIAIAFLDVRFTPFLPMLFFQNGSTVK